MTSAIPLGKKSAIAIALITLIGVASFLWPFFAPTGSFVVDHAADAPLLFAVIIPLLLLLVLAQLSDGGMDAKSIALLGVLAATIAALRPLGAGLGGIEPIWVILILAGRALGPGFGFVLGSVSLFVSALFTGGVGPWLPFQMLAAAWVGLGAGLLPRAAGKKELALLSVYAAGCNDRIRICSEPLVLALLLEPSRADRIHAGCRPGHQPDCLAALQPRDITRI